MAAARDAWPAVGRGDGPARGAHQGGGGGGGSQGVLAGFQAGPGREQGLPAPWVSLRAVQLQGRSAGALRVVKDFPSRRHWKLGRAVPDRRGLFHRHMLSGLHARGEVRRARDSRGHTAPSSRRVQPAQSTRAHRAAGVRGHLTRDACAWRGCRGPVAARVQGAVDQDALLPCEPNGPGRRCARRRSGRDGGRGGGVVLDRGGAGGARRVFPAQDALELRRLQPDGARQPPRARVTPGPPRMRPGPPRASHLQPQLLGCGLLPPGSRGPLPGGACRAGRRARLLLGRPPWGPARARAPHPLAGRRRWQRRGRGRRGGQRGGMRHGETRGAARRVRGRQGPSGVGGSPRPNQGPPRHGRGL
mmetsp:Transcript_14778/g.40425  ORF Transcript_14778/g.40425 Transcript_14778/m.40425 type:complete len:360 (-) Transcript_14778:421-1500(-)